MIAEITMATSLMMSLPLIFMIMTAGGDGQQDWGVHYSPSYICALKGSTVKMSCTLKYPSDYKIETVFWTRPAVTDGDPLNLCLDLEKSKRVQCDEENEDTYSITLTDVTEADKHLYYCRFTTYRGTWTGIPGVQLDVTDLQVETQQSVKERDSVSLKCKSSCSLPQQTTFIWFRNTQRITTGNVKENQLQLQSVSRQDAGNYQCAVSGYEHLISPPVYLKVQWGDGQQDWGVHYSPSYVCALKGSTVKMSCTLKYPSDYKIETVFWTKPGVTDGDLPKLCLVPENRGRVQCENENEDTYSITLTDVTEADKHLYYCRFFTNIEKGKLTGIPGAQLDITDLQVETQQSVKERDSVSLKCKSSCSLPQQTTFIWFRNTQRLTTGTGENQLQLQSVSRQDAGNYQCAVSGYEHLISPPVYLNIECEYKLDWGVNYSPSYVCALKGSTVKMSCTLKYPSDYKIETVFWTKPGVTDGDLPKLCLVPENRGRVQCENENEDTYSITLTDVTEADKHLYYCRFITNIEKGKWTGIPGAQLDITDLQVETQQSVKERDSVSLKCKSSCSLPQQTTFIWFRNTQRLTKGNVKENQLQLQSVSRQDAGNYQCAVSGYEHLISPPVYLNIEYPPQSVSVSISPSGEIVEGDSVTLSCSSDSNPPALIFRWFKENQNSAVGSGQSLIISSFNSSHSGRYSCEAQNQHGSLRSDSVSVAVEGTQRAVLQTVTGTVAGLIFIIIIIIVFMKWKKRDGGAERVRQNQQEDRVGRSAETASTNDVPVYSVVSANQRDDLYANIKKKEPKPKDSGDVEDVQYASVHHFKNKDMNKTEETIEMQHPSDANRAEDVIYSSVK
ncbi:B-cell receptor CD22-like isoform X1 [Carassius carassius]|uniref:B-cell receptor CD22-like isoform X1 n=1 Tax=Carassius carassius TaxID=217509 RepID=UPI0028683F1B|nr:B-cell receptor CD22-like isoform X1 [Carassius carassius]